MYAKIKGTDIEKPVIDETIFLLVYGVPTLAHFDGENFYSHETPVKFVPLDIEKVEWLKELREL